ncbi:MAG: ABC transporter permease, partial [Phycisphaerae bacterium]
MPVSGDQRKNEFDRRAPEGGPIVSYAPGGFSAGRSVWRRLDSYRGLLALIAVFAAGIVFSPHHQVTGANVFLSPDTQTAMFRRIAEYGILAAGMTFVILTGGIDLAVGSVLAMSAMTFTYCLIRQGMPAAAAAS